MFRRRSRFESEVHLGLLFIILLLLFVSFVTNHVLNQARETQREAAGSRVRASAVAISRLVQQNRGAVLSDGELREIKARQHLSGLTFIPSRPADNQPSTRRTWFAAIAPKFPPDEWPELAEKLLTADFEHLTRSSKYDYFYVYPVEADGHQSLLILTVRLPELAYMEGAGRTIMIIAIGSLLLVALIYVLLARYIFRPIRKITEEARQAGRMVSESENEAEAAASEYRGIIEQLRRKETELLRLHQKMQEKAASLERFNQYLLESIDSGIITFDIEGNTLSINAAAGIMLGLPEGPTEGLAYDEVLSGHPAIAKFIGDSIESKAAPGYAELAFDAGALEKRTYGVLCSFIRDDRQEQVGLAVLLTDLSELYQLRASLEQKSRLASLGEMAAGLAHQMRNSLGAIGGFANLIKRRSSTQEAAGTAEALLQECEEAENLIARLLAFARPLSLLPSTINLCELLREVIHSFEVRPESERLEFRLEMPQEVQVEADQVLLKQAFSNIIDNAIIACESESGSVTLAVAAGNENTVIRISDTGSGIPPEDIDKLFTPFFSSRPSGTGLGLPLAGKIVDLHGGSIEVDSVPTRGSTFSIRLPIHAVSSSISKRTTKSAAK